LSIVTGANASVWGYYVTTETVDRNYTRMTSSGIPYSFVYVSSHLEGILSKW
jgi:hypothetical protein